MSSVCEMSTPPSFPAAPSAAFTLFIQFSRCRGGEQNEEQARVLHDALRILSRREGGWLPSADECWSPGEWIAVLTGLVALATETHTLNQYFAEAEQRCENLRKKAGSGAKMSSRSFQVRMECGRARACVGCVFVFLLDT